MSASTPLATEAADTAEEAEVIEVSDHDSQARSRSVGNKRKAGRKPSDAWDTFEKLPNRNANTTRRSHNGKCMHCKQTVPGKTEDLRKHAATCNKSSNQDKLAARYQQIKPGGGGDSSSQVSIASYKDSHKLSGTDNKVLQRLLLLAIIMGGVPFAHKKFYELMT